MPRVFTVGTLVTRAKQRADMEESDFIADTEWKAHLSTAYAELHSILVESGLRYFESTTTVITTGVSDSYVVPTDFLSLISVDYVPDTGPQRPLTELMVQERNAYSGIPRGTRHAEAFSLVGLVSATERPLFLYPSPPFGDNYELRYVPQPADLSAADDADNVDVVTPDGEAFLIWSMALVAIAKEESDTRNAVAERGRARARLEGWATLRMLNQPRRRIVEDELAYADDGDWRRFY